MASCIYTLPRGALHVLRSCIRLKYSEENLIAELTFIRNVILELKCPSKYLFMRLLSRKNCIIRNYDGKGCNSAQGSRMQ